MVPNNHCTECFKPVNFGGKHMYGQIARCKCSTKLTVQIAHITHSREVLQKGEAQHNWPPCATSLISSFYFEKYYLPFLQNKLPKLGGQLYWAFLLSYQAFPAHRFECFKLVRFEGKYMHGALCKSTAKLTVWIAIIVTPLNVLNW
jgi:hypothetical protein